MSAQIDNVRSSGAGFLSGKFADALGQYRERGVISYLLLGGQHFEGCFANGGRWEEDESEMDSGDDESGRHSADDRHF